MSEFWRRWHISLTTWFRDYLYIPLGGNRKGGVRTTLNLFAVFALCGLWHGANWNFLIWGLYHGAFLALERGFRTRSLPAGVRALGRPWTLMVVVVGLVIFRTESLEETFAFAGAMFGRAGAEGSQYYPGMVLDPLFSLALVAGIVGATPALRGLVRLLGSRTSG